MSKMFAFDAADYSEAFQRDEYVHIKEGVSEEFFSILEKQVADHLSQDQLDAFALGDKSQALYQFPTEQDYEAEFIHGVSAVCGLDPERFVISERHIKAYASDANPTPLVHKDRFATEISVGFTVRVGSNAKLELYCDDDRGVNPFQSAAEIRQSLPPDRLPEEILADAKPVEIIDGPRDLIMFRGNSIWHRRLNPADTTLLYFKVNAFNSDPISEDTKADAVKAMTASLAQKCDDQLQSAMIVLGRDVNNVNRRYNHHWQEAIAVDLCGGQRWLIDETDFRILSTSNGRRGVAETLRLAGFDAKQPGMLDRVRKLAKLGVVDLIEAS